MREWISGFTSFLLVLFSLPTSCSYRQDTLHGAPIPRPRKQEVKDLLPGTYVLVWGSSEYSDSNTYTLHLGKDNYYYSESRYNRGDQVTYRSGWEGTYKWNRKTRILEIRERIYNQDSPQPDTFYSIWFTKLDNNLQGKASYTKSLSGLLSGGGVDVKFIPLDEVANERIRSRRKAQPTGK